LKAKATQTLSDLYENLTPWQKTQVARWPTRPHCLDYVAQLMTEFTPFAGDRKFGDDDAIMGGFGRFQGESICVIGQEKGSTTESRLKHNFGMAKPEGYRKAVRLMEMADHFSIPVVALVDTAGAYPGIASEERGQAEAIARSTEKCLSLGVPNVAVILGEGGSGGAIAIATANRVLMLEHAIYSVISPEGAASILWHDTTKAQDAATSMKITAEDLMRFGVIDEIVPEPIGGAHRDPQAAIAATGAALSNALMELSSLDPRRDPPPAAAEIPQYRPKSVKFPVIYSRLTSVYLSFTISVLEPNSGFLCLVIARIFKDNGWGNTDGSVPPVGEHGV